MKKMISRVIAGMKEKVRKHGIKMAVIMVAWECMEHFGFPAILLALDCPWLAAAMVVYAALPVSELVLWPITFYLIGKN